MVFIRTTEQLYITHADWAPALDPISVARMRALYAQGDLSEAELAVMFDVAQRTAHDCVAGQNAFGHLPRVVRPLIRRPRAEYSDEPQRSAPPRERSSLRFGRGMFG